MDACRRYGKLYLIVLIVAAMGAAAASGIWNHLAVSASRLPQRPVVVLDAGHGGEDGGAVSVTGIRESEINLAITLRLRDLLQLLGCKTVLTRVDANAVYDAGSATLAQKKVSDLRNRVELIRQTAPDFFVSIHQNHFDDSRYFGAQVFYALTPGSRELAQRLQQVLQTELQPDNQRSCKALDSVYLMQQINCTGVLVECGFLSNQQEATLLCADPYQRQLAATLASGMMQYLGERDML